MFIILLVTRLNGFFEVGINHTNNRYINLTVLVQGLVVFRGPMNLSGCVIEECGDGEGTNS